MLRQTLLFLSEREDFKNVLMKMPFSRQAAGRFVAGETSSEALAAARALNDAGFRVTLDLLGESVNERVEAEAATTAYRTSLDEIDASDAVSTISLKLTQLGLDIDEEFCYENILGIVQYAERLGTFVRIDMESSEHTERTLRIFHQVFERHSNVGIVIQSYLFRSDDDVELLIEKGVVTADEIRERKIVEDKGICIIGIDIFPITLVIFLFIFLQYGLNIFWFHLVPP